MEKKGNELNLNELREVTGGLTLKKGEKIRIELNYSGGTPFCWVPENESELLKITMIGTRSLSEDKRCGGPECAIFEIEAVKPGKVDANFALKHFGNGEAIKTHSISIDIKE